MGKLTLFAPRLFAEVFKRCPAGVDAERWPALATLLTRSQSRANAAGGNEQMLLRCCGIADDEPVISIAELTLLIDDPNQTMHGVLRADPVHLRTDPHQLLLFNDADLMPDASEADEMLAALNEGIAAARFFRGLHPGRWYVSGGLNPDVQTTSVGTVAGRSVAAYLPRGAGAAILSQLMNDAQMLLHDVETKRSSTNQARAPINSIWLWGGGVGEGQVAAAPDFIAGDDVLAAAIAKRCNIAWQTVLGVDAVLQRIRGGSTHGLVVVGSPCGSVRPTSGGFDVDVFEREWARPLLVALRRFRIAQVSLVTDRWTYELRSAGLWRVWRRIPQFVEVTQ